MKYFYHILVLALALGVFLLVLFSSLTTGAPAQETAYTPQCCTPIQKVEVCAPVQKIDVCAPIIEFAEPVEPLELIVELKTKKPRPRVESLKAKLSELRGKVKQMMEMPKIKDTLQRSRADTERQFKIVLIPTIKIQKDSEAPSKFQRVAQKLSESRLVKFVKEKREVKKEAGCEL